MKSWVRQVRGLQSPRLSEASQIGLKYHIFVVKHSCIEYSPSFPKYVTLLVNHNAKISPFSEGVIGFRVRTTTNGMDGAGGRLCFADYDSYLYQ